MGENLEKWYQSERGVKFDTILRFRGHPPVWYEAASRLHGCIVPRYPVDSIGFPRPAAWRCLASNTRMRERVDVNRYSLSDCDDSSVTSMTGKPVMLPFSMA